MDERPNPRRQRAPGHGSRPVPLEDALLIEKVKNGQTEAYGELVRRYQDRVFNTCWRICGNLEDARDLTQEAFLKCFEHLGEFRRKSGFYTWIFRVAVNLAISHRRAGRRRPSRSWEERTGLGGTQAEELARRAGHRADDDPADLAGRAELQKRVACALQELEDDYRVVIVLRDIEGFNYREIGRILSIPEGTVKSRLHRARMAIWKAVRPAL